MERLGVPMPKLSTKHRRALVQTGTAISWLATGLTSLASFIVIALIAPVVVPLMAIAVYLRSFEIEIKDLNP